MSSSGKTTTVSCRMDMADADFLLALEVPGATTVSDKLRHVVTEYRRRQLNLRNYGDCLTEMRHLLAPFLQTVQELEFSQKTHSELVSRLLETVPVLMAIMVTSEPPAEPEKGVGYLKSREASLADPLFQLFEGVLRMAVSSRPPCYDPDFLEERLPAILELATLLSNRDQQE